MTHLDAEFARLDEMLAPHIEHFRATRDGTADPFGGVYIPDSEIDALRAEGPPLDGPLPAPPTEGPLADLARLFRLTQLERDILLLAAAPEFDLRYQTLYSWLQNDATRKHPTTGFALSVLCATRADRWDGLRCFENNRDLLNDRLIRFVEDPHDRDPSSQARLFRLVPRIAGILNGEKSSDPAVAAFARVITPKTRLRDLELAPAMGQKLDRISEAIASGGILHLRGQTASGRRRIAEAMCGGLEKKLIIVDGDVGQAEMGAILRREARLMNAGLFVSSATPLLSRELANVPCPVFTSDEPKESTELQGEGARPSREVKWIAQRVFHLDLEIPDVSSRLALWRRSLNGSSGKAGIAQALPALAGKFCFDSGQIQEIVEQARSLAILRDGGQQGFAIEDLSDAARVHSVSGLRQLARVVTTQFGWDDLVLPPRIVRQLSEIMDTVRLRHLVGAEWQFQKKTGANPGISVMFSGLSGTGKTMAASILASELRLDLYKIDLSCIVSKYVGETEKNLNRIFDEARNSSAILFFDEADAIFGKRSEVKDAHDRYANIEVAYLLQKMEEFSGLAILATNFARNLDTAFQRRLQHVIEFPFPDAAHREIIWRKMFPDAAPRDADIDFAFLARQFEFSGGNIRNVVIAAAYLAASGSRRICMEHLIQATGREFQKMGKMPSRGDFGNHFSTIRDQV